MHEDLKNGCTAISIRDSQGIFEDIRRCQSKTLERNRRTLQRKEAKVKRWDSATTADDGQTRGETNALLLECVPPVLVPAVASAPPSPMCIVVCTPRGTQE